MITEILFISLIGVLILLIIVLKLNDIIIREEQLRKNQIKFNEELKHLRYGYNNLNLSIDKIDRQIYRITNSLNDYVRIKE